VRLEPCCHINRAEHNAVNFSTLQQLLLFSSLSSPSPSYPECNLELPRQRQLLRSIMWPSREELLQLMGMDDTQWRDALCLQDLLSTLRQQRERNIDAKDVKGRRTGYFYAARSMFRYTFWTTTRPFYDAKRKSLWYLGWKVSLQTCNYARIDY
jgi:hypothetical protein